MEQVRTAPRSPIEAEYGSFAEFEAVVQAGIEAGKYDKSDLPIVLASLRRWHDDDLWRAWHRRTNRVWEFGR